jgi:hypothetical protein
MQCCSTWCSLWLQTRNTSVSKHVDTF